MSNIYEFARISLFYTAFSFAIAVLFVVLKQLFYKDKSFLGKTDIIIFNVLTFSSTAIIFKDRLYELNVIFLLCLPFYFAAYLKLKNFYVSGKLLLTSNLLFTISSLIWGIIFIYGLEVSNFTKALMFTGYPFLLISLFSGLITKFEKWEVLCRKTWNRPKDIIINKNPYYSPKVSVQVPCYSEPPEIVIETLNKISNLNYNNYEVLVIDNNTQDPMLWQPVKRHCEKLGEKFKFFHVENLQGAKAGALNYVMRFMSEDTEIIGVVDSDYQCEPDFIDSLIGHFEDGKIGFVQTPHDYREWENSFYQRMCYWEYKSFFETIMPSLNEKDTALTVGTMCLIRRKALEDAGGWAEWCNTEDSELSIRIHALGYSSVFVNKTYGKGLIPETFAGYKKQRFRWTFGPVQELKKHFRLYLPKSYAADSELTVKQKIHHMNHGLGYLNIALNFLLTPIGLITLGSLVYHKEFIEIPQVMILSAVLYYLGLITLDLLTYLKLMKCSLKDTLGAMFASCSLNHTYIAASTLCLFKNEIPWHRTNKFKPLPLGLNAISCIKTELLMGFLLLILSVPVLITLPFSGLHLFIAGGMALSSFSYIAAFIMAMIAEFNIKSQETLQANKLKKAVHSS